MTTPSEAGQEDKRHEEKERGKTPLDVAAIVISLVGLLLTPVIAGVQRHDAAKNFKETSAQTEDALTLSHEQSLSQARAEISGYVVQIAALDKTGAENNRNEIVTLASQIDVLTHTYSQDKLLLPASTYRLTGQYVALATTDLPLAQKMAARAFELATTSGELSDPLEAIQSQRVLGDIAAQNLDLPAMESAYQNALQLSGQFGGTNRYIRIEAPRFTRAYLAISALMVGQADERSCKDVRRLYRQGEDDPEDLRGGYDVLRRAKRVTRDPCNTGFDVETVTKLWRAQK